MIILSKNKLLNKFNINLNLFSNLKKKKYLRKGKFKLFNSDYLNQVREIQKIRLLFGLSIYMIKRYISIVKYTNKNILSYFINFICLRIDFILYRSNFFSTRLSAKQYISHGLILLNGVKINIHSIIISNNDRILFIGKKKVLYNLVNWFIVDSNTNEYIFIKKKFKYSLDNINIYVILSFF